MPLDSGALLAAAMPLAAASPPATPSARLPGALAAAAAAQPLAAVPPGRSALASASRHQCRNLEEQQQHLGLACRTARRPAAAALGSQQAALAAPSPRHRHRLLGVFLGSGAAASPLVAWVRLPLLPPPSTPRWTLPKQ